MSVGGSSVTGATGPGAGRPVSWPAGTPRGVRPMVEGVRAGSLVGTYQIHGEIGRGGMGIVLRAAHSLIGRLAAIKILHPELARDPLALERLRMEARAAAAVRHGGVVEIFDYGHAACGAFIAMELLEGESLAQRIAERGPLPLAEALAVARRIAVPLAATHARGVVHRDLKPDNVFLVDAPPAGLGAGEQVKLIDFGIAKLAGEPDVMLGHDGLVAGTPAYMAPEQCVGVGACDHRADLYALGCILFELLVGHAPYGLASPRAAMVAQVRSPVPDLAAHVRVPTELSTLVSCLLAKDPADRPSDALEVAELLAEMESWLALGATQTARYPAVAEPAAPSLRVEAYHATEPVRPPGRWS